MISKKVFTANGNFSVPAGITSVTVTSSKAPMIQNYQRWNYAYGAVITPNGRLLTWGNNANGDLGQGISPVTTYGSTPKAVAGGSFWKDFVVLGSGNASAQGLATDNKVYAWGGNASGQLGDNTVVSKSSPVLVVGGLSFMKIENSPDSAPGLYGLTLDGKLYSWGLGTTGQLGNGALTSRSSPVAVLGNLTIKEIYRAGNSGYILTTGGALYAWGANSKGELGVGDTLTRSSPTAVLGGLTFQKIAVSTLSNNTSPSVFGLTTSGAIYSWGSNVLGPLGLGDITARSSPVLVLGGNTYSDVFAGGGNAYAITTSGDGWCLGGSNSTFNLGDGTPTATAAKSSPVLILGGLKWRKILNATPVNAHFGLTTSNTLYAWGTNSSGQCGDGTAVMKSTPTLVIGGLKFVDFGAVHSAMPAAHAIATDGRLFTWGDNTNGYLGVTGISFRSSPVAVSGISCNILSKVQEVTIPVTPGTSYAITMNEWYAKFGNQVIGDDGADTITVTFEE